MSKSYKKLFNKFRLNTHCLAVVTIAEFQVRSESVLFFKFEILFIVYLVDVWGTSADWLNCF